MFYRKPPTRLACCRGIPIDEINHVHTKQFPHSIGDARSEEVCLARVMHWVQPHSSIKSTTTVRKDDAVDWDYCH